MSEWARFRGSAVALAALLLAVVTWWGLSKPSDDNTAAVVVDALIRFDKADLHGVRVQWPNEVLQLRKVDGLWHAEGHAWVPRAAMIRRIAHQLHDLDARANVVDHSTDLSEYGLGEAAVQVTLDVQGQPPVALRVGDLNPTSVSTYVQMVGRDRVYIVKKAAVEVFRGGSEPFREDRFAAFEVHDATRIQVTLPGAPDAGWAAERRAPRAWDLTSPQPLPGSRDHIERALGTVASLRALRFLEPEPLGASPQVAVTLVDGRSLTLQIGPVRTLQDGERVALVLHEEGQALYGVRPGWADELLQDATAWRRRRVVDRHASDIVRLEVSQGASTIGVLRSADGWRWPDQSVVAGSTPERLAGAVAELTAVAFHDRKRPDFGFDKSDEFITAFFDDGSSSFVRLGDLHRMAPDDAIENARYARIDKHDPTVSVGLDLDSILADLRREYARKQQRREAKRLDATDQRN